MTSTGELLGQLTPHRANRIVLPSTHGPIAALAGTPPPGNDLGATVLFLPGYTGSKEDLAPLLDPLTAAGLGVVAIDLPGQYESPGPDDEAAHLPAELGPVVVALSASLGPRRVVLIGHSYGGFVARSAVLAGARVAGLVLLCSGPAALPPGRRHSLLEIGEPVLREQGIHAVQALREAVDAGRVPPSSQLAPRLAPELAAFLRARFLATSPASLLGMGAGLRAEPDRVDELAATLALTGTGCLVACGELDDAWPPPMQRQMAARLGARFATIADAGHSPNTENPEALLELLLPVIRGWLGEAA